MAQTWVTIKPAVTSRGLLLGLSERQISQLLFPTGKILRRSLCFHFLEDDNSRKQERVESSGRRRAGGCVCSYLKEWAAACCHECHLREVLQVEAKPGPPKIPFQYLKRAEDVCAKVLGSIVSATKSMTNRLILHFRTTCLRERVMNLATGFHCYQGTRSRLLVSQRIEQDPLRKTY